MKITRSVKCYYPWLTVEKKQLIKEFIKEAHNVVCDCVNLYEQKIINGIKRQELTLKKNLQPVKSWLTERAKKNCFYEAHGLVSGAKLSYEDSAVKYHTPKHNNNRIMLSCTNTTTILNPHLKSFDLLVKLRCFDSRKRRFNIPIPLKRNKLFNKWFSQGELCNSILLSDKYIQFSFEINVVKKKEGSIAGYDPGAKTLFTDDIGNKYGQDIWRLLLKLKRKKKCSKIWYKCRSEIQQYIDATVKHLSWSQLQWFIIENNKGIKHKIKVKKKVSKHTRSILAGWMCSRIDNRIQMLSEENGVYLRRVPAFYNSIACPMCGCCKKENRATQNVFRCVACGHTTNPDQVGSLNALARFSLGTYGSECKSRFIEKHPEYYRLKMTG